MSTTPGETPTPAERVLWERPANCRCGAEIRQITNPPRMRLIRVVNSACPMHGEIRVKNTEAVERAMAIARTVPGLENLTAVQLRRIIEAIAPVFSSTTTPR